MADKVYHLDSNKLTAAMRLKCAKIVSTDVCTVDSLNVSAFEAGLTTDESYWISCDEDDVISEEGNQANGIILPPKMVR